MKTAKHNTNSLEKSSKALEQEGAKPAVYIGDYRDFRDFKMKPATEGFIERLAKALIQWSEIEPQAYKLNQFLRLQGLSAHQFYEWAGKYPELKLAHDYAMRCMGDRREIGAMEKRLSETMVFKRQHAYDPDWEADRLRDKQDKIDVSKAVNDNIERPTQIILGQLPGLDMKELVE